MQSKTKKIILGITLVCTLLFSMVGVLAQNKYTNSNKFSESQMKEVQNQFQNRYQFNCTGECVYEEFGDNLRLQIQEKVRLFPNLENIPLEIIYKDEYVLDQEGNLIQTKHNIWSRFLNKNRIRL